MNLPKVLQVLEHERDCILRNVINECSRECDVCDLVLPDNEIISAYGTAIEKLQLFLMEDDMEPKVLLTIRILEEYMVGVDNEEVYNALVHATTKLRELFNFSKEDY